MSGHFTESEFIPLNLVILTVSDSRTEENDKSGHTLKERALEAGHRVLEKAIVPDDIYQLRALVSRWIADGGGFFFLPGPPLRLPQAVLA